MASNGVDFSDIRRRVAALRKPDLHECLERLGMRKGGNKPELQRRLLDIFEDSYHCANNGYGPPRDVWRLTAAQRIIEDVHNKLMSGGGGGAYVDESKPRSPGAAAPPYGNGTAGAGPSGGAAAAAAVGPGGNPLAGVMSAFLRERAGTRAATSAVTTVRCVCGSAGERLPMLQCRAAGCGVWQHAQCVGLAAGARPAGGDYYCELCRAKRADPFWEVEDASLTTAMRLSSTGKQAAVNGAMQPVRSVERSFSVTAQQHQKFRNRQADHQLQLVCLQLNDQVPFRFHWPLGAALEVNGVQYRVYSRGVAAKLGANARDEPANIGLLCPAGRSRLSMQCTDSSPYVLLVLLARRRQSEEVRELMLPQLSAADAAERVRQQLRGDDDDEVQTGATVVSLRCPILGTRVRTPARFPEVPGLACFDLDAFLDSAARTRKWQCPTSMTHSTVHSLQIDTYMQRIVNALVEHPSVMEVEVAADASWRPSGSRDQFYSIEEDHPLADRAGGGASAGGAGSDGEETDEEEELRRAAAAVAGAAGQKRKRAPSPDVIDLASSEDEDEGDDDGAGTSGHAQSAVSRPQAAPLNNPANGNRQQPGIPAVALGGGGAAAPINLRIPLTNRRLVPSSVPAAPAAGLGGGQHAAAAVVAGPGAVAPLRHHLGQLLPVAQQRSHPNPHQHQHPLLQAHTQPLGHPQPALPQQQRSGGPAATDGPSLPVGAGDITAAAAAAGVGGAGGISHRQPVSAALRNPIRILMAAGGPCDGHEGTIDAAPPGLPLIAPYRQSGATAMAGEGGTGVAGAAMPAAGGAAAAGWSSANGAATAQQAHSHGGYPQHPQQQLAADRAPHHEQQTALLRAAIQNYRRPHQPPVPQQQPYPQPHAQQHKQHQPTVQQQQQQPYHHHNEPLPQQLPRQRPPPPPQQQQALAGVIPSALAGQAGGGAVGRGPMAVGVSSAGQGGFATNPRGGMPETIDLIDDSGDEDD